MTYEISFDQRPGANQNKIVFVATRGVADDATVNVFIDLIDPSGSYVNTKDFGIPDLVVTTPGTKTWDIPKDSNSDFVRGTYTVMVYIEQTDTNPGVQNLDESGTYYFKAVDNPAKLEWDTICIPDNVAILTVKDTGNYQNLTISNRSMTLVHPAITGVDDTVTSGTSIQAQPTWANVEYFASISAEMTTQTVSGDITWNEYYEFTDSGSYLFNCSTCDVGSCIQEFMSKYPESPDVQKLLGYEAAYRYALNCGRNSDASEWANKISSLTKCDCGCGSSTEPVQLTQTVTILTSEGADGSQIGIEDAGGYFDGDNVEDVLQEIGADTELTDWTLIPNSSSFGTWDFESNPAPQLQWRRVGNRHIELMGTLGNTGLSANVSSTFLLGYFQTEGINLKSFYGPPVSLTTNGGLTRMRHGGVLTVQYAGPADNLAIHVSNEVTPVGTAQFYIHTFIPIEE